MMTHDMVPVKSETELKLQVYLTEYEKLRDELVQNINHAQQILVLVLGSASIAVPLLAGQATATSGNVVASLLYLLAIIYSVLALNNCTIGFNISVIGKYIHVHIEPEINGMFQTVSKDGIFIWESFIRQERSKPIAFFLSSAGSLGSMFILLIPSAASLLAAEYARAIPTTQISSQYPLLEFLLSLLPLLSIIAWLLFILTIFSTFLVMIYGALSSRWIEVKLRN